MVRGCSACLIPSLRFSKNRLSRVGTTREISVSSQHLPPLENVRNLMRQERGISNDARRLEFLGRLLFLKS
jgi:hypothetical protein